MEWQNIQKLKCQLIANLTVIQIGFHNPLSTQAIQHKGFALIDIFSPCVTFNKDNSYQWFKPRLKKLEDEKHDFSDWKAACEKAMIWSDDIYYGKFFQIEDRPTLGDLEPVLDEGGPICFRDLGLTKEQSQKILKGMM